MCEKFLLSTHSLERLPDMLKPRAAFGVCWHLKCVYLCGGVSPSIESFGLQALTFSKICTLPKQLHEIAVCSYLGALYIIGESTIWKKTARKWQKAGRTVDMGLWCWRAPYFVSVLGHFCYFIPNMQCLSLDLRTLTETSYNIFPALQL